MVGKSCLGAEICPNEDVCKKTLSARNNFVLNVVQNYRGHNLIFFQVHLETKVQIFFEVLEFKFLQIIFVGNNCSFKMKRNTETI